MINVQKGGKEKEKVAKQKPFCKWEIPSKPVDRMGWLCLGVMAIEGLLREAWLLKQYTLTKQQ